MHTRRVTRFHPTRSTERNPSWRRRLQKQGGAALLILSMTAIVIGLARVPTAWMDGQIGSISGSISSLYSADLTRVEEHWVNLPQIPKLIRGDEPKICQMLTEQPLIVAILDRDHPERLWLRKDNQLIQAAHEPERTRYLHWIAQATGSGGFRWTPPLAENTDPNLGPAIVLSGERWIVVKHWSLGSPQVERALQFVLGPKPLFRTGLRRSATSKHTSEKPQEWGAEPHLQVDSARLEDPWFAYIGTSPMLEGWDVIAIPFRLEHQALQRLLLSRVWRAFLSAVVIAAGLGLGFWLRRRARRRAMLDSDRLASLTHSLKTPLAILKFRCDSIRLGRLGPDQSDSELIKISEEVDHLTLMIENGLEAIQGVAETGPQREISAAWLSEIAQDLAPAFEAEDRTLHLALTSDSGRASRPSLRTAILTLLENALYHGNGEVTLQTIKNNRRLQIRITNGGDGLEPHQVEALGKPFLRLRNPGREGFEREGQGLGLSLLVQVAQKEGWGLSFASAPAQGFLATLEIRAM